MITKVVSISILLSLFCVPLIAEDGKLTGVAPLAVYVELDGLSREVGQEITDGMYIKLREARVPTTKPKGLKTEDSPFIHFEITVRRVAEPSGYLLVGLCSVKVPTQNPLNGTPMHGLITSSFIVEFREDINEMVDVTENYLNGTLDDLAQAWRAHNPLPGEFVMPKTAPSAKLPSLYWNGNEGESHAEIQSPRPGEQ
ncbi:hypothetical protein [Novipirellula caenicola]|uniref:Uncharacterized protein n=1 Tax=Novipirellula caenicola TaxID=1536901 RepID=A0ABP9VME5_9BACT